MYLLDTPVVSELRRDNPHRGLVAWLNAIPEAELFVSAVTVGEIAAGIESIAERDEVKAQSLTRWLDQLAANQKVLPMDQDSFWLWAKLRHGRPGTTSEDAMIAATALLHNLTLVTGNSRAFEAFDVPLLNPFRSPPRVT